MDFDILFGQQINVEAISSDQLKFIENDEQQSRIQHKKIHAGWR